MQGERFLKEALKALRDQLRAARGPDGRTLAEAERAGCLLAPWHWLKRLFTRGGEDREKAIREAQRAADRRYAFGAQLDYLEMRVEDLLEVVKQLLDWARTKVATKQIGDRPLGEAAQAAAKRKRQTQRR